MRHDGRKFVCVSPPLPPNTPLLRTGVWQDSLIFFLDESTLHLWQQSTGNLQSFKVDPAGRRQLSINYSRKNNRNDVILTDWFSTAGNGQLTMFTFRNGQFREIPLPDPGVNYSGNPIIYHAGREGHVFIYNKNQLCEIDESGNLMFSIPAPNTNTETSLIREDPNGDLLVMMDHSLFTFDVRKHIFTPHPANKYLAAIYIPTDIREEKNGDLWGIGNDRAVFYYNAAKDSLYDFRRELTALFPHSVDFDNIYKDRSDILWVTSRMGLLKITPQVKLFDTYYTSRKEECAGYCSFRGIAEDETGAVFTNFYYKNAFGALAGIDPLHKKELGILSAPHSLPFGLKYHRSRLWLNSGQYIDTRTYQLHDVPGAINTLGKPIDYGSFETDAEGRLWWVYSPNLYLLHDSGGDLFWEKIMTLPIDGRKAEGAVWYGAVSRKLWISGGSVLLSVDPETRRMDVIDNPGCGKQLNAILAIGEDADAQLWMATDMGLLHLNPQTKTGSWFTTQDGLPNDFISGMLPEGDSCLWLATNNGLSRLNTLSRRFINFFAEDGLAGNEFNRASYFKAHDGRMFFGGIQGITGFFPEEVMRDYRQRNGMFHVVLSSFSRTGENDNRVVEKSLFGPRPEIHLFHQDRSFTFEYALTDYDQPEKIYYSYQMEGYENTWSAPSSYNFTRYSSLPPGSYVFRVKARNSRGNWNPNMLEVRVVVHPPWWATVWAYIAYLLILCLIICQIYRFLKKRWVLQNQLQVEKAEADRLKELDSFKSKLFTNLTHEFRTPLTVILGMNKQISREPQKFLEEGTRMIERNGQNLLHLINQMLDLSKLENNALELHPINQNIVPFIRYIAESFQTYANSRNLSLRFFTTIETLVMDYDPEQIKQVLTNLISNAIKFTEPDGEIMLHVSATVDELQIKVRDTGKGIAAADVPYIFDRFFQAAHTPSHQQGTGIGLAHTRELIKLMGGTIGVETEMNKGSVFTVRLPITNSAPKASPERETNNEGTIAPFMPVPAELHPTPADQNPELPLILLIEDNPDVLHYIQSCLQGRYRIDIARNGRIGVEKALTHIPDLVITDVMMPEIGGYEVCDLLKNDDKTSHIPIIILTAKADTASRLTGLRRGADVYLSKPFDVEELLVYIATLLSNQKRIAAYFAQKLSGDHSNLMAMPETETLTTEDLFLKKVKAIVEANYADEYFGLPQLCQKTGMSRSQLFRKMKAVSDTAPSDLIRNHRLSRAKELLASTGLTVSEVAFRVGFKDVAHFSKSFSETFGMTPGATRK
jgi:signal transduction histidine kinase/DNA-binding response OmpR family regulator